MAREIRALTRGLAMLEAVNLNNGAPLRTLAEACGLPKATAYRVLESLRTRGYLRRAADDERYFVTLRVRRLSDGFTEAGWIAVAARPLLLELAAAVGFPVAIATPYGAAMMVRDNTDGESALAPNVYSRGTLLPLLTSATGKVYLAFCDDITRTTLVDLCARSPLREHALARQPAVLATALEQVRRQGYAFGPGAGRTRVDQASATLAVPIRGSRTVHACLALRYLSAHLRREDVLRRYLPLLQRAARRMATEIAATRE